MKLASSGVMGIHRGEKKSNKKKDGDKRDEQHNNGGFEPPIEPKRLQTKKTQA